MYTEINRELNMLEQKMIRINRSIDSFPALALELKEVNAKMDTVENRLRTEEVQYVNLTQKTVENFIYHLKGTLKERTEKELMEYLDVSFEHDEVLKEQQAIEQRIESLTQISNSLEEVREQYRETFARKLKLIAKDTSEVTKDVKKIKRKLTASQSTLKLVRDAILIGDEARNSLKTAPSRIFSVSRIYRNINHVKSSDFVIASFFDEPSGRKPSKENVHLKEMLGSIRKFMSTLKSITIKSMEIDQSVLRIENSVYDFISYIVVDFKHTDGYSYVRKGLDNMKEQISMAIELLAEYAQNEESKQEALRMDLIVAVNKVK